MNLWVKKFLLMLTTTLMVVLLFKTPTFAKSGCCSWHGGVCGCDSSVGRQVCCDGTYSPTCTCPISAPVNTPTTILIKEPTPIPSPKPILLASPSPKPSPQPSTLPSPKSSPSPEVKGVAEEQKVEPVSDAEAIGLFGVTGAIIGTLGWAIYKLFKKFRA